MKKLLFVPLLLLLAGTLHAQSSPLVVSGHAGSSSTNVAPGLETPDGYTLQFVGLAGDPTCSAGLYYIYVNLTTLALRKCVNGTISDIGSAAGAAWSGLTAGTNSNAGTFAATGNTWDFSGVTQLLLRKSAGCSTTVEGDECTDTTTHQIYDNMNALQVYRAELQAPAVGNFPFIQNSIGPYTLGNVAPAGGTVAGGQNVLMGTLTNGQQGQALAINSSGIITNQWLGVVPNAQTGTTYTVAGDPGGDRGKFVTTSNAGAIAVTLPQANSNGFGSNFFLRTCDIGAGTATWTPTTSNISYSNGAAYTSAAASLALTTGQCAWIFSDNTNYFAIVDSNGGSNITKTLCSGTVVLGTSAIGSAAKGNSATSTCTGLATMDAIILTSNAEVFGITGFTPSASGILTINCWPTANTVNCEEENNTSGSITPAAVTVNYRVTR